MQGPPDPTEIVVADNQSVPAEFNDEKPSIEFHLTRTIPELRARSISAIRAVLRGIHGHWVYKQLEGGVDGIIDLRPDHTEEEPSDIIRIRFLRNAAFDRRWHQVMSNRNLQVTSQNYFGFAYVDLLVRTLKCAYERTFYAKDELASSVFTKENARLKLEEETAGSLPYFLCNRPKRRSRSFAVATHPRLSFSYHFLRVGSSSR